MRAVRFHRFGGPAVLVIEDAPEPYPGPGQIRIRVQAASVNPVDWKIRSGMLKEAVPISLPAIPGADAAGIVDQIGAGVTGVKVGDEVFGRGDGGGTLAEYAVLRAWAPVPFRWTIQQAAAAGVTADTATLALDVLGKLNGKTLLIDGAAGGVGSAAVELALARGATVIGTASKRNHDFLRSLGAIPTTYGDGLADRVATLAPRGIDAAIDMVGSSALPLLVELAGQPGHVVSVVDPHAASFGALYVQDAADSQANLAAAAALGEQGRFSPRIGATYSLDQVAAAHAHSQGGHSQGKIVIDVHDPTAWLVPPPGAMPRTRGVPSFYIPHLAAGFLLPRIRAASAASIGCPQHTSSTTSAPQPGARQWTLSQILSRNITRTGSTVRGSRRVATITGSLK